MFAKSSLLSFLSLIFFPALFSQNYYFPLNDYFTTNVQQIIYSPNNYQTSVKPYLTSGLNAFFDIDSIHNSKFLMSGSKKHWKKILYEKIFNEHLITLTGEDFSLYADPLFNQELGYDLNENEFKYINTRGFQLFGTIGKNVGFYSSFYENQGTFPEYINQFIQKNSVVPGQGNVREFNKAGFDYAMASGYVSYSPSKHFNFQFGHGKNFWGDGYRSLLLSDVAFNYPFLKITTNFWRIKYVNLYAQFQDLREPYFPELGYLKKYGTLHYLSFNVSKRLNISLFEAIIWEARDSTGIRGFDINYLNPVIFYRPVEFSIGSPDNALMGSNVCFKLAKHNVLYAQLLLDEFRLKEVLDGKGWWGNKQAFQLGFKSFDVFRVPNLFFLAEYNYVKPYTYSHRIPIQAYGHYNQSLAHPLVENFWEFISIAKYNIKRFYFQYQFLYAIYGEDIDNKDYGKDIFKSFNEHVKDYDNYVGQGLQTQLIFNDLRISYLINPSYNMNFTLGVINRNQNSDIKRENYTYIYLAFRTSIDNFYYDF